jgi:hypothetical protein
MPLHIREKGGLRPGGCAIIQMMTMRLFAVLAMLTAFTGSAASAAVQLVRSYQLQPPRDRHIAFSMAITGNQDLLSFVASSDGKWRLSRVRRWINEKPQEDRIVVRGLVLGDRRDWSSPWSAKLLLTPNGKFVICIASAWRAGGSGMEEFVSVVSLADFKVVASAHPREMSALTGSYRTYSLDRRGNLTTQAFTPFPRHPGDDISAGGSQVRIAVFSLPGLDISEQCVYSEWTRTGAPPSRRGRLLQKPS